MFRKPPTGLLKWFLHAPAYLFRVRLGFLFGDRILLLTHVGRKTGRLHQTPVQVVEHTGGEYFVLAGRGPRSQWYRNLQSAPAPEIQVGNRSWRPEQRLLTSEQAAERFATWESSKPRYVKQLLKSTGNNYDGTNESRVALMEDLPVVAFSDKPAA